MHVCFSLSLCLVFIILPVLKWRVLWAKTSSHSFISFFSFRKTERWRRRRWPSEWRRRPRRQKAGFSALAAARRQPKRKKRWTQNKTMTKKRRYVVCWWIFFSYLLEVHQFVLLMHFFLETGLVFEMVLPCFIYFFFWLCHVTYCFVLCVIRSTRCRWRARNSKPTAERRSSCFTAWAAQRFSSSARMWTLNLTIQVAQESWVVVFYLLPQWVLKQSTSLNAFVSKFSR